MRIQLCATLSCLLAACVPGLVEDPSSAEPDEWSLVAEIMPEPELAPRDFPDAWWEPVDELDWPGRGGEACRDLHPRPDWRDCRACFMLSTRPDEDGELPIVLLGFEVDEEGRVVAEGQAHEEGLVWWYDGAYRPDTTYHTNRWGDWTLKQTASGFLVYQDVDDHGPVWEVRDCTR